MIEDNPRQFLKRDRLRSSREQPPFQQPIVLACAPLYVPVYWTHVGHEAEQISQAIEIIGAP